MAGISIKMPVEVLSIIRTLNRNGYKAYAVGGCVRDCILGLEPKDWDITTNAKPQDVKRLFGKTVDTGIIHGTVTVILDGQSVEVTTYRVDGRYVGHRRPETVEFTSSLEADLGRRDFTVNAIAFHPDEGVLDPFKGIDDIKSRIIRTVGDPAMRFNEDALRMLRAVRFSAQLDFWIHKDTLHALKDNAVLIKNISAERIRDELTKILLSDRPERFSVLNGTGLLHYILPELEVCFQASWNHRRHVYNSVPHALEVAGNVEKDIILRWTALLHNIGETAVKAADGNSMDHVCGCCGKSAQTAEEILKRLKFDNKTTQKICRLVKYHNMDIEPDYAPVRKAVNTIGEDLFCDLLKLQEADKKAQNPCLIWDKLEKINKIRSIYSEIKEKHHCLSLHELAVNGRDLEALGLKPGREMGEALKRLLDIVIENPELNSREALIEAAKKLICMKHSGYC